MSALLLAARTSPVFTTSTWVAGRLTFGLGRCPGNGVRLGCYTAMACGPGVRELGTEKQDQGGVIDPHEEYHYRPGCTVGRAHAGLTEVIADGGLTEVKRTAVMSPPGHTSCQLISASGTYL